MHRVGLHSQHCCFPFVELGETSMMLLSHWESSVCEYCYHLQPCKDPSCEIPALSSENYINMTDSGAT